MAGNDEKVVMNESSKEARKLLSPCTIDAGDASHLAVDDLRYALEQSNSRNIAVTGHYGSGKSSVVNTCIEEMGIEDKVLRISMSTFYLQDESNSKGEDLLYSDDIEYKIVQHLLYKCDKSKIPYSRFQLIQHIDKSLLERYIVLTLIAFGCFIIAFEPTIFQIGSFYDAYDWFFSLFGKKAGPIAGKVVNFIADAGCIVYLAWFAYKVGVKLADKINRFRNFKFEAQGISMETSTEVSVFNKYLDEIIYILQANHYNYILFEDLDRLANSDKLFLKIRELNMLINESEAFKSKKRSVRFVYAIKDDVFTRELRTKCFDYIVAVVPVVDHYNVTDYVINEYQGRGLFKSIDIPTLKQLTGRISGLRELKNIANEYTLFEKSLRTHLSADVEKYEQKLLAVIVYKNLFPRDFAKIYLKKGLFYSLFENKQTFTEGLTAGLKEQSTAAKANRDEARKKIVEIRGKYLEMMNREVTVDRLIKDGYDYTAEEVAAKDNLFEMFTNDEFDKYTYHDHDSSGTATYNFKFRELENLVTDEMGYYEAVSETQDKYNESNEDLIKIEKEIKVIENTNLQEILKKIGGKKTRELLCRLYVQAYPAEDKNKQKIDIDMVETLQSFVFGGYITEDYYLYISKFYEGSLSESDYQFVNAILQGIERPYSHKLDDVKEVVAKLSVNNFREKGVLNYDILNYLIDTKKEYFLSEFVETSRKTPEFVVSYFQMDDNKNDQFFKRLFDGWDGCVMVIKMQEKQEMKDVLLKLFLREAPQNIRISDEEKKWLNGQYEFIHKNIQFLKTSRLNSFVGHYGLCFEAMVKSNAEISSFYDYCISNRRFVINERNLEVILGDDYRKKPMTAIQEIKNDRLRTYLKQDIGQLIALFPETCDAEERSGLEYLIEESGLDIEWLKKYTGKQKYVFDGLDGIKADGAGLLLGIDKLSATWINVYDAFKLFEDSANDILKEYVARHVDELAGQKCELPDDKPVELQEALLVTGNLPFDVFKKLIKTFGLEFIHEDILQIDDEKRIREILVQDYMTYDKDTLSHISKSYSQSLLSEYFIRYYDDIMADGEVDVKEYVNNELCMKILISDLSVEKKGRFLFAYADIDVADEGASELACMILQFYLTHGFGMGVRQELLVLALQAYQDEHEWFLKIRLINKYNATCPYERDYEKELINSLRGEYTKLNTTYGRAKFDVNEENGTLLEFLKQKGHYVNDFVEKVDEKENVNKYVVSFKSFMPGEYVNAALV